MSSLSLSAIAKVQILNHIIITVEEPMFAFNMFVKMPGTKHFSFQGQHQATNRILLKSAGGVAVGRGNLRERYRVSLWSLRTGNTTRLLQK